MRLHAELGGVPSALVAPARRLIAQADCKLSIAGAPPRRKAGSSAVAPSVSSAAAWKRKARVAVLTDALVVAIHRRRGLARSLSLLCAAATATWPLCSRRHSIAMRHAPPAVWPPGTREQVFVSTPERRGERVGHASAAASGGKPQGSRDAAPEGSVSRFAACCHPLSPAVATAPDCRATWDASDRRAT